MLLLTTVLPTPAAAGQPVAALEQVVDRDGEVVVRIEQPGAARDDAVAIVVGVARPRDVEAVRAARSAAASRTATSSPCGCWPSQSTLMKRKVGSTSSLTTVSGMPMTLGDRAPVRDAGAAERIDAEPQRRAAHARRGRRRSAGRATYASDVVVRCVVVGRARTRERDALHARAGRRRAARWRAASIQPVAFVSAGPPFVPVVLEAAVLRRIVRRRDDDAVGETRRAPRVVGRGSRARRRAWACSRRARRSSTSTPFAASTSSALPNADSESACVSMPRNSGPSMPCSRR